MALYSHGRIQVLDSAENAERLTEEGVREGWKADIEQLVYEWGTIPRP